jgi:hypothetical protein
MMISAKKPTNMNEAYYKMTQEYFIRGSEERYKEMRRLQKRIVRKKTRKFHEKQMKQAEPLCMQKESRRFFLLANDIRKECRPHIKACRDSDELNINKTPAIMNRWKIFICFYWEVQKCN